MLARVPAGYTLLDPADWSSPATPGVEPYGPIAADEWAGVYRHLGARVADRIAAHRGPGPAVIGVAGSVAVGKSTFAAALAALLVAGGAGGEVRVISTDGFLRRTADLGRRAGFKGFPDTYDEALIDRVLGGLAAGDPDVTMPVYSHELYDIVDPPVPLGRPDAVILEGVNALGYPARYCTATVYLDADESAIRAWYVRRFVALIDDARARPESFFAQWTGLAPADAEALAVNVWEAVNLVNLTEHILPLRWSADLVVHKGPTHRVEAVATRTR